MRYLISSLLVLLNFLLAFVAQAQTDMGGDELNGFKINGENVRQFKGNVYVKQPGKTLYCDLLNMYSESKRFEAFGNVRIVQDDGTTATGDTMYFLEKNQFAKLRGNVTLTEKDRVLTTRLLDYYMNSGTAYYYNGAKIVDGKNTLTSVKGEYNRETKTMIFRDKVRMQSDNYTLDTDTLRYNTDNKIAFFSGATKIVTADGVLSSNKGQYDTNSEVATFEGRSVVNTPDYRLISDYSNYDKANDKGIADGNVVMFSKKDSIIIYGEHARYSKRKGYSKIYGKVLMKSPADKDTLFLTADTLLSLGNTDAKTGQTTASKLLAYNHVRIFRTDMQAICDSLAYNFSDSTIYFFQDPVLWNSGSQLTSDSIWLLQKNNHPDKMYMRNNAFIISLDSLKNYNQVKGKNMVALFNNNQIQRINITGNGQSLYFALEGDTVLTGMNRVTCSNMIVRFKEKNKLNNITFITKPEAAFIPPHELEEPEKKLKGFKWRVAERPTKRSVIGAYFQEIKPKKEKINKPKAKNIPKKTILKKKK